MSASADVSAAPGSPRARAPGRLPEPDTPLPAAARAYWRVWAALQLLALLAVALVAWPALLAADLPAAVSWLGPLLVFGGAALVLGWLPELRWRRWRYAVRDDEIDLRHGALIVRRTLVPIRRVQHVESRAGPLQSGFGLATVSFHTAAGTTTIPALAAGEAERVRARVALLARTRDDS